MQRYTIVSDLHLGRGDAREDFLEWGKTTAGPAEPVERERRIAALGKSFFRFLESQLAAARGAKSEPHLVLLGDFVDLWQVRRRGENPAVALEHALRAHGGVVAAIRSWTGAGGAVSLILGNHDHALCDPRAWALLREVFPNLNARLERAPAWSLRDDEAGLWAVHGHRWDTWNRIRRRTPNDACVGRLVNRALVNPLEERYPLIDKGDLAEFLLLVREAHTAGHLPSPPQELLDLFIRIERGGFRFCDSLAAAFSVTVPLDPAKLRAAQRDAFRNSLARELERMVARKAPELPHKLRFVAFGHTHDFARVQHSGICFLNTGTWRPLLGRDPHGAPTIRQPLHYAVIENRAGEWRAEMGEAAKPG